MKKRKKPLTIKQMENIAIDIADILSNRANNHLERMLILQHLELILNETYRLKLKEIGD